MAPIWKPHLDTYGSSLIRQIPTFSARSISHVNTNDHIILPRSSPLEIVTGVTPPQNIPNRFVFTIFGLIGAGFVITTFWFFFRAKNGGFEVITKSHWDNYKKSVVARSIRTGQSLSNATLSTKLGGGSIYQSEKSSKSNRSKRTTTHTKNGRDRKKGKQLNMVEGTIMSSDMSEITSFTKKFRHDRRKRKLKENSIKTDMESIIGDLDHSALDDLIAYRHEKPARVGGLNTQSEASTFSDSVINGSITASTVPSLKYSSKKAPKHSKDILSGGIRKVVSTSEGHQSVRNSTVASSNSKKSYIYDEDRIKSEARRLQEKGRTRQHRDFSFQAGDDDTVFTSRSNRSKHERRRSQRKLTSKVSESFNEQSEYSSNFTGSEIGTKTYHHPIPELTASSVASNDYYEEKRRKRNGSQAPR
ncbi:putative endosomal spry domain-containing protein [Erysiphe neolycopersici]|uniref:Putative endosomal spry domain-containing protein n=1 Tax=Erysiphe neolycopersici TaxID=212602 RepID=A0A420HYM4_9PEZI|nr:putative endosomal spry domain-containing protein [Erysiphe neolycopersici]